MGTAKALHAGDDPEASFKAIPAGRKDSLRVSRRCPCLLSVSYTPPILELHPFLLALLANSGQGLPRALAGWGLSLPCTLPSAPPWFCLGSRMGLGSHLPAKLRAAGGWSLPCLPPPREHGSCERLGRPDAHGFLLSRSH